MYYHASSIGGITRLEPHISNHGLPLIYFSTKRENVLVYLSNSVEKYCRETGFVHKGKYQKWGPYGFDKDGRQRLEEYYPNALASTYKGVSGYVYFAETVLPSDFALQIPDAIASSKPVNIAGAEFVPDAYEAILRAEEMRKWNEKTIADEYAGASEYPEYRHFLKGNFPEILKSF